MKNAQFSSFIYMYPFMVNSSKMLRIFLLYFILNGMTFEAVHLWSQQLKNEKEPEAGVRSC